MQMKRYMVFASDHYYPMGGMSDFVNDYDNIDEAKKCADDYLKKTGMRWGNAHVFDVKARKICYIIDKNGNGIVESTLNDMIVTNDEILQEQQ